MLAGFFPSAPPAGNETGDQPGHIYKIKDKKLVDLNEFLSGALFAE
jgi:hypothetical protein